jgi:GNAT superfamily N-acetyltransferase
VRRELGDGFELDDDRDRIDVDAVHGFLSTQAYWAIGRSRDETDAKLAHAERLVGLYHDGQQIGFTRTACVSGMTVAYLYDVYVLPEYRGRGLGLELVRETVDSGPFAGHKWLLDTDDAHGLYAKLGFGPPPPRHMQRQRREA